MRMRSGLGVLLALTLATPIVAATAAPADGFATFWTGFAAAVAKDDQPALASMIKLGPALGDSGGTFAKFHAGALGPGVRRCLAKAKPVRDVDPQGGASYSAFCGEVIYVFSRSAGAWKLT